LYSLKRKTTGTITCGENQKPQAETRLRLIIMCIGTGLAPSWATVKIAPTFHLKEARSKQALQKPRWFSSLSRASFRIEIVIGF
jgi:hypothetical protein